MKKDEEALLKQASLLREDYAKKHPCLLGYFNHVSSLSLPSLRAFSFQQDLSFFKECSFALSLIETIAHRPHIVAKNVDAILRADQASNVTPASFLSTIEDPSLWKRKKDLSYSPEYVHVEESEDDIKIYENIFICMALRSIEREIAHYEEFYSSLILSSASARLTQKEDHVLEAFAALKPCKNKIERIKKSDFYKRVGKEPDLKRLVPTNILKSDPIYSRVYRFYGEPSRFASEEEEARELLHYFLVLILTSLKKRGFSLFKGYAQKRTVACFRKGASLVFASDKLQVRLVNVSDKAIAFDVVSLASPSHRSSHLLFLESGYSFASYAGNAQKPSYASYDSLSACSIWNLVSLGKKTITLGEGSQSAYELMDLYLDSILFYQKASKDVYSLYCPHCKSKGVTHVEDSYSCPHCHSSYYLETIGDEDYLFFKSEAKEAR